RPSGRGSSPWWRYLWSSRGLPLANGAEFDLLVIGGAEDQALHENPRQVDLVGIEAADRYDLLNLGHRHAAGGGHRLVEVARRLAADQVARLVRLAALVDGGVADDAALQHIGLAVELLGFLALRDQRAGAGLGVEAGDAGTAGAAAFGQRAMGAEL